MQAQIGIANNGAPFLRVGPDERSKLLGRANQTRYLASEAI
jgi:hypothetical protein